MNRARTGGATVRGRCPLVMGVPLVIHFSLGFSIFNKPSKFFGYPPWISENPRTYFGIDDPPSYKTSIDPAMLRGTPNFMETQMVIARQLWGHPSNGVHVSSRVIIQQKTSCLGKMEVGSVPITNHLSILTLW